MLMLASIVTCANRPGYNARRIAASLPACTADIVRSSSSLAPLFVRLGAHLGSQNDNDPFKNVSLLCHTLYVEPQPQVYERLMRHIADHANMSALNAAACGHDTTVEFFTMNIDPATGVGTSVVDGSTHKFSTKHSFTSQIASTSREHVLKHQKYFAATGVRLSDYIRPIRVPCLSLRTILQRTDGTLLLLSVDAEGNDAAILDAVDWSSVQPHLVVFEQGHLNEEDNRIDTGVAWRSPGRRTRSLIAKLRAHGYLCDAKHDLENAYCVHRRAHGLRGCRPIVDIASSIPEYSD